MKNVTRRQRQVLNVLSRGDASRTVRWNDARGVACALSGTLVAALAQGRRKPTRMKLKVKARLRPTRAVHFAQRVNGEIVGGVTYALRWE